VPVAGGCAGAVVAGAGPAEAAAGGGASGTDTVGGFATGGDPAPGFGPLVGGAGREGCGAGLPVEPVLAAGADLRTTN
jgi:hypothetical protein